MIHIISLSDDDCLYAIERKEFSEAIVNAGENVAVVMSQDWCPQWLQMNRFLNDEVNNQTVEITVFIVEYNKRSFFNNFMKIKDVKTAFKVAEVVLDKEHKIREMLAQRGAKAVDFSFDFDGLRIWELEE